MVSVRAFLSIVAPRVTKCCGLFSGVDVTDARALIFECGAVCPHEVLPTTILAVLCCGWHCRREGYAPQHFAKAGRPQHSERLLCGRRARGVRQNAGYGHELVGIRALIDVGTDRG